MSVLVIRCDDIGDMLLTLPLLEAIRRGWPQSRVTVVARPVVLPLVRQTPLVDETIGWTPLGRLGPTVVGQTRALLFARRTLRSCPYDLAVLPRWGPDAYQSRYLASGSSARKIVGFAPGPQSFPWESGESVMLSATITSQPDTPVHELARSSTVATGLGLKPEEQQRHLGTLLLRSSDRIAAGRALEALVMFRRPIVAVVLGAAAAKRQWPVQRYASVLSGVHVERPVAVVVLGASCDEGMAQGFVKALPPGLPYRDFTGKLDLKRSLAVLEVSSLYLGGDTGPMHMACSVGTPAVVVSCHPRSGSPLSSNSPARFGPWASSSTVLQPDGPAPGCDEECRALIPHCILDVLVPSVTKAVVETLGLSAVRER